MQASAGVRLPPPIVGVMDQLLAHDSSSDTPRRVVAELALFALWCGYADAGASHATPRFAVTGLVTSARGILLQEAALLIMRVAEPCWLITAGDDPSPPDAILHVTVSLVPPDALPAPRRRETPGLFRFPSHLGPPSSASDTPTLVFGGHVRLRVTPSDLAEAQARFGLFGRSPVAAAGPADSPWAAQLLPTAERAGCEWAILLGHIVAHDPPWNRDAF